MPFSILGVVPGVEKRDLKALVVKKGGADPGDDVVLLFHGAGLWEVRVNYSPEKKGRWQGAFWFDRSAKRINIQWMHRPDNAPAGWGRKKFLVLASRWQADGYRWVHASPADGPPTAGMTGYYFWPLVGFDGRLAKEHRKALPKSYRHCETIRDLFAMNGGPEVWKQYGSRIYGLTFDLETL